MVNYTERRRRRRKTRRWWWRRRRRRRMVDTECERVVKAAGDDMGVCVFAWLCII